LNKLIKKKKPIKNAAEKLHGIWKDLPKSAIKELMKKTY
jgi:hypothetical protein